MKVNAQVRNLAKKNVEKATELQIQSNKATAVEYQERKDDEGTNEEIEKVLIKQTEITVAEMQVSLQLGESITESMPQIMLQSVFIIRSYNDPDIPEGDLWLISFSVLASLFSIANKFVVFDETGFKDFAKSLSAKMEFPGCVNYWYILRVSWRMSDIMSKFALYVLIWTVLGGAFLPIWAAISFIGWGIWFWVKFDIWMAGFVFGMVSLAGIFSEEGSQTIHLARFAESIIGLSIVLIFAMVDFECEYVHHLNQDNFQTRQIIQRY